MKSQPKRPETAEESKEFLEHVYQALVRDGSIVPTTIEEVRAAEALLAKSSTDLPPELETADEALARAKGVSTSSRDNVVPLPPNQFAEVKYELARAARKGEAIPPSVESKMRENRMRMRSSRG